MSQMAFSDLAVTAVSAVQTLGPDGKQGRVLSDGFSGFRLRFFT